MNHNEWFLYARQLLKSGLNNREWHIQFACSEAFAHLGEGEEEELLVDALEHENSLIRDRSVIAISKLQEKKYTSYFKKMLKDSDSVVKGHAIESLALIEKDSSLSFILECIEDKNDFVKESAVVSLSHLQSQESLCVLEAIANQKKPYENLPYTLALTAAYYLAEKKNTIGFEVLKEVLNCGDIWLEFLAAKNLSLLGKKDGLPQIQKILAEGDWSIKLDAITTLISMGEDIAENLELMRPSEAPNILTKISAAIVLYEFFPKQAEEVIKTALTSNQEEIELHTIETIASSRYPFLLLHTKDILLLGREHVRAAAVMAIEKTAVADFLPLLIPVLEKSYWLLQIQAARAILKIEKNIGKL